MAIIEQLTDYLNSKNSSERFRMLRTPWERVYGLDFYENIGIHLSDCQSKNEQVEIKIFHFLYEHKNNESES